MKQHITLEQWRELSDKSKVKLLSSGISAAFPLLVVKGIDYPNYGIGQMIEFLWEGNHQSEGVQYIDSSHYSQTLNIPTSEHRSGDIDIGWVGGGSFCDALWEAVKHKLKNP